MINKVRARVTQQMNESLLAPFTADEIKKSLFNIGDLRAPGQDGLHAVFFKRFWPMLENDLVTEVLQAVNTKHI